MPINKTSSGTAFQEFGDTSGEAVVLIHGLGLCQGLWAQHVEAFSRTRRVITYDLYGHGNSAPAPETASLTLYAKQLAELMDYLNIETAVIIGFSIGGMINRRFALDFSERVTSLVILNSPHDRGEAGQKLVEERASKVREQGAFATFDAALERWFTPDFRSINPEAMQLVRDWRGLVDAESYAQTAWVLANGVTELIGPEPPVKKPTLVMTGENDSGSTPNMSRAIAAEIEGAELLIVPGLQHLGLMENPEAFTNPILDFIKGNSK